MFLHGGRWNGRQVVPERWVELSMTRFVEENGEWSNGGMWGYTPGDVYEVYLNDNDMPIQWAFHKAGGEKANLTCTWEGHKKLGPLHRSLDHRTADGGFRLWISNVSATLKGGKVVKPE